MFNIHTLSRAIFRRTSRCRFSTSHQSPPKSSSSRVEQIAARLPKSLRPYATRFAHSPGSHLTSFLILHEITAILPLGGLFWVIHKTQWSPPGLPGEWVQQGMERWGNYTRKKGWEMFKGEKGARMLLELATAFAVVKALLPVRIGLSLWATPWFARLLIVPITSIFRRGKKL
ncbi:hypothetical protein EDC01DRAFT_667414 [Geopyxis carbonaria]|nr:hypothetical protein EDC01DRAFT_667414 [Geopyxis carbonaria]